MAKGRWMRGMAALIVVATAAAAGSGWLPALGRQRTDAALLAVSLRTPPIATLNRTYAPSMESLFFRSTRPRLRVGIQAGHWRQGELPQEFGRLRGGGGAAWGPYREVDINLSVARELVLILERGGIEADLLSSTVPPGYLADAVLAIHADGAARPTARGWKMAAPWRGSEASNRLLDSLSAEYGGRTGLPHDPYGITINMKGYYAFSPHRFEHAVSPLTPAVIVETGFVTMADDREVIAKQPRRVAEAIAAGLIRYFANRSLPYTHEGRAAYLPRTYPSMVLSLPGDLRAAPGNAAPLLDRLDAGVTVVPMQLRDGWAEVRVNRGAGAGFGRFGWVRAEILALPG
jgi:N-acetylmuramoyl-L-alanine amidase